MNALDKASIFVVPYTHPFISHLLKCILIVLIGRSVYLCIKISTYFVCKSTATRPCNGGYVRINNLRIL